MTYLIHYEPWQQAVQAGVAAAILAPILVFKVLYWCGFFSRRGRGSE